MIFLLLLLAVFLPPLLIPRDKFKSILRVSIGTWYAVGIIILILKLL